MVKIIEPKIETAELRPDGSYGKFIAEPLDRGFGITLGNSLRRVLSPRFPAWPFLPLRSTVSSTNFPPFPV